MADELTSSSVAPICPPGSTADPLGHNPSLEERLASLSQNMGHMADMMGKMYDRLNENDDVLSQRPPCPREKRQRRRPPTDSESDPEEEDRLLTPSQTPKRRIDLMGNRGVQMTTL